jgi:hypothetical protein
LLNNIPSNQIKKADIDNECDLGDLDEELDFLSSRYAEYSGMPSNRMNVCQNRPNGVISHQNGGSGNLDTVTDNNPFLPGHDENIKGREIRCFSSGKYDFHQFNKLKQDRKKYGGGKPPKRFFLDVNGNVKNYRSKSKKKVRSSNSGV